MIHEKLLSLLKSLQRGTNLGQVPWQDVPDEEMFHAQIRPGFVRVGRLSVGEARGYTLLVIRADGVVVAELEITEHDSNYSLIEDLFMIARLWARNGEQLIDRMITQLTLA